jgi:hypothetical protein
MVPVLSLHGRRSCRQGRYNYLTHPLCDDAIDCIVLVLLPASRTGASFSTPDDTLYAVPRNQTTSVSNTPRSPSAKEILAHPMLLQETTATSRKSSVKVTINDRDPEIQNRRNH